MSHVPCFSGDPVRWCTEARLTALGLYKAPLQILISHVPCFSGDPVRWCTGALLAALGLVESAQVHSKLIQVVQTSTTLPRRCRQDPGSPEGAGWPQVLPRRCRQVLLSPDGAGRCLRSRRCSVEQVSRSDGAGVISVWCSEHQVSSGSQVFR